MKNWSIVFLMLLIGCSTTKKDDVNGCWIGHQSVYKSEGVLSTSSVFASMFIENDTSITTLHYFNKKDSCETGSYTDSLYFSHERWFVDKQALPDTLKLRKSSEMPNQKVRTRTFLRQKDLTALSSEFLSDNWISIRFKGDARFSYSAVTMDTTSLLIGFKGPLNHFVDPADFRLRQFGPLLILAMLNGQDLSSSALVLSKNNQGIHGATLVTTSHYLGKSTFSANELSIELKPKLKESEITAIEHKLTGRWYMDSLIRLPLRANDSSETILTQIHLSLNADHSYRFEQLDARHKDDGNLIDQNGVWGLDPSGRHFHLSHEEPVRDTVVQVTNWLGCTFIDTNKFQTQMSLSPGFGNSYERIKVKFRR